MTASSTSLKHKLKLNFKISHRNWSEALNHSFVTIVTASPGEVVCITGPSRAGKSMLVSELEMLLGGCRESPDFNQYLCVSVMAKNTGPDGRFSTKAFAARLLDTVDHPSLELLDDLARASRLDRLTENAIITMLERCLVRRGVRYLFIDEAQHVRYTAKAHQAPSAVMDSWKCLSEAAGIVLVVVGAYPILSIISESPHLSGRTRVVHFPPYAENNKDAEEFLSIANTFLSQAEQEVQLSLEGLVPLLYQHTLGCIGLLRLWFIGALNLAELSDKPLTEDILESARLPYSLLEGIIQEMKDGEHNLLLSRDDYYADNFLVVQKGKSTNKKGGRAFCKKPRRMAAGNRTA